MLFRSFELVRRYKGAHSGEHGDGLVRSEFHEAMYGAPIVRAFEAIKDSAFARRMRERLLPSAEALLARLGELSRERAQVQAQLDQHRAVLAQLQAKLGEPQASAVFRIIQESLTNVARHSGATEVSIEIAADPRADHDPAPIHAEFERAYFAQYGFNPNHVAVEVVNWRLTAHGPDVERSVPANTASTPGAPRGSREVTLWASARAVPVYERRTLATGQSLDGPALIEERETTIVIPPGWRAVVDRTACIIATPAEA